jgi:hypothetical protein
LNEAELVSAWHECATHVRCTAIDLRAVAERLSYAIPGSPAIKTLYVLADDLEKQVDKLDAVSGPKLGTGVRQANEASRKMLKALCAGLVGTGKFDVLGVLEGAVIPDARVDRAA